MTGTRRRGAWARPVASLAIVAFAVGCGSPDHIDARALERVLPGQIVADHPDVLTDVVCPAPIHKRAGTVTACTAALAGTPVVITVTQLDDNGATSAALDKPVLDVEASAGVLAARFTKDLGVSTTVECEGPAVRVLVVGEVLRCTARDPSLRSRSLDVTVRDAAGTLDASLS
jgi:hypothetical protein